MMNKASFLRLRCMSPAIPRRISMIIAVLVWAESLCLCDARAAEPIVIDSALLRLTQQIDVPARRRGCFPPCASRKET